MTRKRSQNGRENASAETRSRDTRRRARRPDRSSSRADALQQGVGNQAVQQLYQQGSIQAKLEVNSPDDPAEREAERVAERVVRMDTRGAGTGLSDDDQRDPEICVNRSKSEKSSSRINQLSRNPVQKIHRGIRGSGKPLSTDTRQRFESRLGMDFSGVRVHTNSAADAAARSINAEAYTVGSDIVFSDGKYDPNSVDGSKLLAHELTHVVQQTSGFQSEFIQRQATENSDPWTPFDQLPGNPAGGMSTPESEQNQPQATEIPLISTDIYCQNIDEDSKADLRNDIRFIIRQVRTFHAWQSGEGWEEGAGNEIPSTRLLNSAIDGLRSTAYTCADDSTKAVPGWDPLVMNKLYRGFEDQEGLMDLDPNGVDLIRYWISYSQDTTDSIEEYFDIVPISLDHTYGTRIQLGVSFGGGLGAGGKVDTPLGEIALGCYPKAAGGGEWIQFSYANNLGLSWSAEYGGGGVDFGAECAARISVGPSFTSSFGQDDLCSGSAISDIYYGPDDFTGARFEVGAGVDGGVVLTPGADLEFMRVYGTGKDPLDFDMSGPCAEVMIGLGAGVGGELQLLGGQVRIADPKTNQEPILDVANWRPGSIYEIIPSGEQTILTRHLFYPTGSTDALEGQYADHNIAVLYESADELLRSAQIYPPDEVTFVVTGHASPRWRSAGSREEAHKQNETLAFERAANARSLLAETYMQAVGDGWPTPTTIMDTISPTQPSQTDELENMGSSVGLAETGDPESNLQRHRRSTIKIRINFYEKNRKNLIDRPEFEDSEKVWGREYNAPIVPY